MNADERQEMQRRRALADKIYAHPHAYRLCLGCGSVEDARHPICRQCRAYRFDSRPEIVREAAIELAERLPEAFGLKD